MSDESNEPEPTPARGDQSPPHQPFPDNEKDIRAGLKRGKVVPSWSQLRSIGNSRAAQLTILIPLIAYLILLNDTLVNHLELSRKIFGESGETLTKLLLVYLGLICVAAASAIYSLCCPLEVKRHASVEEYVAGEEPFLSQRAIGVIQNKLTIGDDIARSDYAGYLAHHEARPVASDVEVRRRRVRDLIRIQLHLYYEMLDRSLRFARWAAAVFYLAGLILLLIPSTIVFCHVMAVLWHRFMQWCCVL